MCRPALRSPSGSLVVAAVSPNASHQATAEFPRPARPPRRDVAIPAKLLRLRRKTLRFAAKSLRLPAKILRFRRKVLRFLAKSLRFWRKSPGLFLKSLRLPRKVLRLPRKSPGLFLKVLRFPAKSLRFLGKSLGLFPKSLRFRAKNEGFWACRRGRWGRDRGPQPPQVQCLAPDRRPPFTDHRSLITVHLLLPQHV